MAEFGQRFNAASGDLSGLLPSDPDRPVLIAGPTASGKSELALRIAEAQGGVIVNADASQVYDCWQIVTARPGPDDLARAPHRLFGHVGWDAKYSAGHWLREASAMLGGDQRPIFIGGTGLYFTTLTQGMAEIPPIPAEVRAEADAMTLEQLLAGVDPDTAGGLDRQNRARVQRAWEVERATGRPLAEWQRDTPPPVLPVEEAHALVLDLPKDRLEERIARRFDTMLAAGALDEVAAMLDRYDPARPVFRAIGVPELAAHLNGELTLEAARDRAIVSTRQYAKRQRTWFRSRMGAWRRVVPQA